MDLETLKRQYDENKYLYDRLNEQVVSQIKVLLDEHKIKLASPLETRVKEWSSIAEKCERNQLELNSIADLNDLAGIRLIVLFSRDLEMVCNIIQENFEVRRIENTSDRLTENQFGYGSIHFEFLLKDSWVQVPSLRPLKGLVVELQLRTASQNIWAATSHILQYKREKDVPKSLRRSINRVAALLETIDLEYERLLQDRDKYISDVDQNDKDELLNTNNLEYILNKMLPLENKNNDGELYSELINELIHNNIKTVRQLEQYLETNMEHIMNKEREALNAIKEGSDAFRTSKDRIDRNVFFTHVGLVRNVIRTSNPE